MAGYKGFKFGDASYTADAVWFEKQPISAYRAEYARLYQVAKKRLKRFEKAGRTRGQEYKYAKQYIKPLHEIKTERDLGYSLADLHRFLKSPTSTLRGLKAMERKISNTLINDWTFTAITPDKVEAFGEYMDYLRDNNIGTKYGSSRWAELFAEAAWRGLDPQKIAETEEDFNYFMENLNDFTNTRRHRKPEWKNLETYRSDIEKMKEKRRKKK